MKPIKIEAKRIADELNAAMAEFVDPTTGKKGISARQLGLRSGVPQPTISRTLSAESIPETKTLAKLSSALGRKIGGYQAAGVDSVLDHDDSELIAEAVALMRAMSQEGRYRAVGALTELRRMYPAPKANHFS